jgi:hypothetical protein
LFKLSIEHCLKPMTTPLAGQMTSTKLTPTMAVTHLLNNYCLSFMSPEVPPRQGRPNTGNYWFVPPAADKKNNLDTSADLGGMAIKGMRPKRALEDAGGKIQKTS